MMARLRLPIILYSLIASAYAFTASVPAKKFISKLSTTRGNDYVLRRHCSSSSGITHSDTFSSDINSKFYFSVDKKIAAIALPAFVSLVADPLASIVDALFIGRLDPMNQAGMGIAISAHYAISKLYNDPLLKTSTSLVADKTGKSCSNICTHSWLLLTHHIIFIGDELSAAVSSALLIAGVVGLLQMTVFLVLGPWLLTMMRVPAASGMRPPALAYLRWRAVGVPAATVLLVAISKSLPIRTNSY